MAAPIGGLLWGFGALAIRLSVQYILARRRNERFTGFDRPVPHASAILVRGDGGNIAHEGDGEVESPGESQILSDTAGVKSKGEGGFF